MPDKTKWYQGGLAFECRACGRCCSGPDEGYVWLTSEEIATISAHLGMTEKAFKARYCYRVGPRYSLIEQEPSKDCVFLEPRNGAGKGCRIYQVRPMQCRTWPFWPNNLPLAQVLAAGRPGVPGN